MDWMAPDAGGAGLDEGGVMADDEIKRLRMLMAKATPGPWAVHYGYKLPHIKADDGGYILEAGTVYGPRTKADAALIVAAVNALRGLLDEVERLRAEARMTPNAKVSGGGAFPPSA